MGRGVEHAAVVPEDILRAVAMMHVEIYDRDPLQSMDGLRMARRDRNVVEETEAHRRRCFGVMARRAHRDESIDCAPSDNLVYREHRAARRANRRFPGS